MTQRARAWAATLLVIVVMGGVPLLTKVDSMPLSTYPMFASPRTRTEPVDTAVVVTPDGAEHRLSPRQLAGTDEVILAGVTVSNAIAAGTARQLCAAVAGRVGGDTYPAPARVEVVTETYDAVEWYEGDKTPDDRVVHASCPVEGAST